MDVSHSTNNVFLYFHKLKKLYEDTIKPPDMSEEDISDFFRNATALNLWRLKYIAILLILENLLFLIVFGFFVRRTSYVEYSLAMGYYWINTIFFIPPAIIILLTLQTPSVDEIKKRHLFINNLTIAILLAGVIVSCIVAGDSTLYFVAVIFMSLALTKKIREMLIIFTCFLLLFILGIHLSGWESENRIIDFIEAIRITGIGFLIFLVRLRTKMKVFQREKLIQVKNIELAEANSILKDLSMLDALTGIPNRRSFDVHLSSEWKRAIRESSSIGLLLIDIDFFKKYNDRYGHQQGDECLKKVAKKLHSRINRIGDLVARYGGEEFVAVLPNDNLDGTAAFGEKLRKSIADLKIEHKDLPWQHVTVSVGAASCKPNNHTSLVDFVKSTDEALYKAKEKGRNRVEMHR